jgi:hypothetical protein
MMRRPLGPDLALYVSRPRTERPARLFADHSVRSPGGTDHPRRRHGSEVESGRRSIARRKSTRTLPRGPAGRQARIGSRRSDTSSRGDRLRSTSRPGTPAISSGLDRSRGRSQTGYRDSCTPARRGRRVIPTGLTPSRQTRAGGQKTLWRTPRYGGPIPRSRSGYLRGPVVSSTGSLGTQAAVGRNLLFAVIQEAAHHIGVNVSELMMLERPWNSADDRESQFLPERNSAQIRAYHEVELRSFVAGVSRLAKDSKLCRRRRRQSLCRTDEGQSLRAHPSQ